MPSVSGAMRRIPTDAIGLVSLADLREALGGTRTEQDALIKAAEDRGEIALTREDNPQALTPRIERATLWRGGYPRHYARAKRLSMPGIGATLHEYKAGQLYTSAGRKVTSRKQAVAIGLNQERAMAAKKRTAKKRTTKRRTTKKRSVKRASPVAKAMKAASRATEKRIMAQWHEKTAKLNAECQLSLHQLKQTSRAAVAVEQLRIV